MRSLQNSRSLPNRGIKVILKIYLNFLEFVESVASKFDPSIE